ncbi:GcvT family protein [Flavihumibacter profundi]|uniref:GcvT family protein n=1 Tax=Flavihumibacter profundi TaxID=2716883 RepID=UPI001CC5B3F8|nr:FAD-dependent oxidoreductase [Flavihumibacter profundi]MBZ5856968.1 FAD-dependent oxidoreductase [Flavihumibacter profundi]
MSNFPDKARIVIIGGGVAGASIAYHFALKGETDVVIVERGELTSGSTFHSAGLVGQLRGSVTLTSMMMYSAELYRKLSKDPETDPGWVECGGIRLACTPERVQELKRQVGWATTFGLPLEEITAERAKELFPLMSTEGVLGATYLPTDGYLDPSLLCFSLANEARRMGVKIYQQTRVTAINKKGNQVVSVTTDRGTIETEMVVAACGLYTAEIGRMVDVRIPIIPMSHQYLYTAAFRKVSKGDVRLPTLRDPDNLVYYRESGEGLVMGGYERKSAPSFLDQNLVDNVPKDFNGKLLTEDWDRFEEIMVNSAMRVPAMATAPISKVINGPEAFTPDNEFCLGPTSVKGFFVAAGFCAHGIAGAGGVGREMATWLLDGSPGMDLWEMDVRRFGVQYKSYSYTLARVVENYESYYDIRYPGDDRKSGRPLKISSAYEWHKNHGAFFGEKSGWERVNYYTENENPSYEPLRPTGWAGKNWSTAIITEALATREKIGLYDESSFSKIEITGPGAAGYLEYLCANKISKGPGHVTYTQMLNEHGGIESDVTVTQVDANTFRMISGTALNSHDTAWLTDHLPSDGSVVLNDVTASLTCFGVWGPSVREMLSKITSADLSNQAMPFLSMREIKLGDYPVQLVRVTFVGELGYEIYADVKHGMALWELIWEAGKEFGMVACGYKAIDALRAEKGYLYWGSDISTDVTPFEAGLSFAVAKDKDFLGKKAMLAKHIEKKLVTIKLEDPLAVVLGNEPVRLNGKVSGRVTSGGYGASTRFSIAFAYLPVEQAIAGNKIEILVFGNWIPGDIVRGPIYDPKGQKLRS